MAAQVPSIKEAPAMTVIRTVDDGLPFADRVVAYMSSSDYFGQEGYTLESVPAVRFGYVKKISLNSLRAEMEELIRT